MRKKNNILEFSDHINGNKKDIVFPENHEAEIIDIQPYIDRSSKMIAMKRLKNIMDLTVVDIIANFTVSNCIDLALISKYQDKVEEYHKEEEIWEDSLNKTISKLGLIDNKINKLIDFSDYS